MKIKEVQMGLKSGRHTLSGVGVGQRRVRHAARRDKEQQQSVAEGSKQSRAEGSKK
jgi:hypothetical protein